MEYNCECIECGRLTFKSTSYMRLDGGYVCRFCEEVEYDEVDDDYEDDDIED